MCHPSCTFVISSAYLIRYYLRIGAIPMRLR
uniref:Uncharacterized protein n=1 Tax=Anguilla anguilla TaxID=7936 RepID=A0A0E9W7N4_ANGAN